KKVKWTHEVSRRRARDESRRGDDAELRTQIPGVAVDRRRSGHRRVHVLWKCQGVEVNHKTLRRLEPRRRCG
ncbi:MAG: hypothetical protein AAF968_27600, partial [Pseudomonadota bacterium]